MSALAPMQTLDRYGPQGTGAAPSLDEARDYVRTLTAGSRENFSVLSRLVPARLRDDFAAVYAFCRWADDLGDETGADGAARVRSLDLLSWWRRELEACFAWDDGAEARHPVFVALRETARRHALPAEPFHDLISAFEQDQRVTRYATWDQLLGYCAKSANPVGRIVLRLAGERPQSEGGAHASDLTFSMSDDVCTALQLINFWQDVRRDLVERDRVYLPSEETGLDAETLREWMGRPNDPEARVPYIKALRPLVDRTRAMFEGAADLPTRLSDPAMRPVVWLFGAGGLAITREVEKIGCATLWTRPTVSKAQQGALVLRAWLRFRMTGGGR
ncbi:MAG: squalene synthase HpnC [Phycisphaerales bacterium]